MAAVVIAAVAVAVVLLNDGGSTYHANALFQNAAQLVKGNLVQVAGRPVGKIEEITLTKDGQAKVHMKIDEGYAPLREGTQATIRQSSLSGVANRYIDLRLPPATAAAMPDGGTLTQQYTNTAVDLDEIFNIFGPRERASLSGLIRGFASLYPGREKQANAGTAYLNPSLAATSRLFRELNYDEPGLRGFIKRSANLVSDINERRDDLSNLILNLRTTTGAIGNQRDALASAIQQLPDFMRRSNTTFVNLRATLNDLTPLVNESKPVAKKLRPFLAQLRPLARNARPTLRDLSALISTTGNSNDLIDLTLTGKPLRNIAIGPVDRNGKSREGAFPASINALNGSTPELGFARPYAPDLTAWFDDFSHSGIYDSLGSVGRVALNVNLFTIVGGLPGGIIPPALRGSSLVGTAQLGLNNRCPGSSERGAIIATPEVVDPKYGGSTPGGCNPNQVPPGP
jgi:phospholipid/cholesterol/gamma-HCH transport system substrate-binding protein